MQEGYKSLGMPENIQFGWEIFILNPVAYITVDFKQSASDLFHAGSSFVGNESIKRKTKLSE